MVILLTGATGFIGRPLAAALAAAGHEVVCAVRDVGAIRRRERPAFRLVPVDFARDVAAADWVGRLKGIDVVVNAAGILRERGDQTFRAIHWRAPMALFAGCASAGVRRVVQISALGADDGAVSRYHRSKKAADDFLLERVPNAVVVQPSLVYGSDGASARLFTMLASLPLVPLPGRGEQSVQPIHLDDAVEALVRLVGSNLHAGARVPLVGPAPLHLRSFIALLRHGLGLGEPRFVPVPLPLMRAVARVTGRLPGALLDRETLAMLERGNTADARATYELLGRMPRAPTGFIAPSEVAPVLTRARLAWLLPVLRLSIALVWIVAGIVSLGLYPTGASYKLLARAGISGLAAPVALYGAAIVDLLLGAATLLWPRRWLWLAQIGVVLAYTAVVTFALPEFWLHPYGPIVKNLPLLAALWLLYEFDDRRWTT